MHFPAIQNLSVGWRDILDILLITLLLYQVIIMVKQTRAVAAIYGLTVIVIVYLVATAIGLNTLSWLLDYILGSLFLLVVIVFQRDIRQGLTSIGARRIWLPAVLRKKAPDLSLDIICETAHYLAAHKIGALIVIERNVPLGDTTDRGVQLDARLSRDLLISLFWPNSPMHDGAVIISQGRILAAGCILPLSTEVAKRDYGTRHRAALGITEESDSIAVVVSEERGTVAVAMEGRITGALKERKLFKVLESALEKSQ